MNKESNSRKRSLISRVRVYLYNISVKFMPWMYRTFYGMEIGEGTNISRKVDFDKTVNPRGIHIGSFTRITGGVTILAHDDCRKMKADTYIGDNCFIGVRAIIMPGLHIGNQVVIGGGVVWSPKTSQITVLLQEILQGLLKLILLVVNMVELRNKRYRLGLIGIC